MARLPEQQVWDGLRNAKKGVPAVKLARVENATEDGMPDVHGGNRKGVEFWLELKQRAMPARNSTPVAASVLRPSQVAWMKDWSQYGIKAFVVIRLDKLPYLLDGLAAPTVVKGELNQVALAIGYSAIINYLAELE